jgi:hypothetical protein
MEMLVMSSRPTLRPESDASNNEDDRFHFYDSKIILREDGTASASLHDISTMETPNFPSLCKLGTNLHQDGLTAKSPIERKSHGRHVIVTLGNDDEFLGMGVVEDNVPLFAGNGLFPAGNESSLLSSRNDPM